MKRTTKKVLAAFLAALMAVYCLPFTALAGQYDYGAQRPVVYATYYSGGFDVYKATQATATQLKLSDDSYGPLMSAPQTLDDISQLQAGDAFAVTFWLKGMDTLQSLSALMEYDATQIQPLHILAQKSGSRYNCSLTSRDEAAAAVAADSTNNKDIDVALDEQYNAEVVYEGRPGSQYSRLDSTSYVKTGNNVQLGITNLNTDFSLPYGQTEIYDYAALESGADTTHYDDLLLYTVNFYVLKDNPTDFWSVENGCKLDAAGNNISFACSYLKQDDYTIYAAESKDPTAAGSGYFTVLGFGDHATSEPTTNEYTVTYNDASGNQLSTETVTEGGTPANIPQLPATANKDASTHNTYAWDTDPSTATITADTTFNIVATAENHTWDAGTQTTAPTHTDAGEVTYTCTACGATKTEPVDALGHTPAATPTSNNNGTHSYLCTEDGAVCSTEDCSFGQVVTAPTCTEQGYTTYTCSKCGYSYVDDYTSATGHNYGAWTSNDNSTHSKTCSVCGDVVTDACSFTSQVTQQATATLPELTQYTCTVCGYQYTAETAPALGHTHNYGAAVADYTSGLAKTDSAYTHTQTCTGEGECSQPTKTANCTFDDGVVTTAATCGTAGVKTYTCTVCGGTYTEAIPATGAHNYGEFAHTTGTADASSTHSKTCSVCGDVVTEACSFTSSVVQEATYTQPEITEYTCSVCGYKYQAQTAPALVDNRVTVSVDAADMGTTTLNEADSTLGSSVKLNVGDAFTLTATPNENCEFVGWQLANKIVSTSTTLTGTAYTNVNYTPVFVEKQADTMNFVFVDMYGNVISNQTVTSAADVEVPTAPTIVGYTFTGWSADATQATESATIYAQYAKDTVTTYTVTAAGCDITDGETTTTDTLAVPYETQVTVSKEGATAWEVNGVTVAYGDSYTFYVGNNIEVTPVVEAVVVTPSVAIVSSNPVTIGDYKVQFVSTRTVTDGYTFIQAGFVYGKNVTDTDLALANVGTKGSNANSGNVKVLYASSTAGDAQFVLNYGVSAMNAPACAKAFITVKAANGTISTIYSNMVSYNY